MTDVLSKNLFDLLGDDGEEGVPRPQPVKQAAAPAAAAPAQQQKKDNQVNNNRAPRNEYRPRGGAGGQRGDRVQRTGGPRETGDFERPPREGQREGQVDGQRGGYRGGRGGRGGPRGGGAGARGREFDRRSGTGRRDTEKKEVAGKGSWGNPVTAEEEGAKVAEQEIAAADGTATPEENAPAGDAAAAEPETPKEPEEVLKTLDQYFAEVQAKKGAQEANVRKANEGADESQWKDAVAFVKEEEDYFIGGKQKGKKAAQTPKEKAQKVFAAIEQRFADEPKRGGREGGRGGRGGNRGGQGGDRPESGRGRGGQNRRGGRAAGGDVNVNVADERAFPSLGGK
ncbi:hypothetical protein HK097_009702 [Rhizophlyctis rosea]|uniref:Hyaluronan/mRNA-binding protein domain-containing protein n=1 Tax=Rhizophlyctis rosea TaxID=64517 RepID=A0AAD5SAW6_9FUNG|nr:hypothetical protein HK097_009702 [Rhizophlyctis rosea]